MVLKTVGNASDAQARTAYVFYNYHSVQLPHSGIENLIKFVTSQLALTLLRFFLCCDVRQTPGEVIRLMEESQDCEVLHLDSQSTAHFEEEMSRRALNQVADIDGGLLVLVTGEGDYALLLNELGDNWDLGIFHPADTNPAFHSLADIAVRLPITFEGEERPAAGQLRKLRSTLEEMLERMKQLNGKMKLRPLKKAREHDVKRCEEVEKKGEEPPRDEKEEEEEQEETTTRGLGWDSFPAPDPRLKTTGWDEEVSKELEAEKAWKNSASPFPPPVEKKNPFGGNPFEPKSKKPAPPGLATRSSRTAGGRPPASSFGRQQQEHPHHLEQRFPPAEEQQLLYMGGGGHMEENPFPFHHHLQQQSAPWKESRNPFGGGRGGGRPGAVPSPSRTPGGPLFKKPGPQCPQWEDRTHRASENCPLWHPFKQCMFYPMCRSAAAHCGYAHPFCTDGECQCDHQARDPQLNHFAYLH